MIAEVLQMSKHRHPLILIFVLFLFINIAFAETQLGSYEFYDGFESGGFDKWDGILRGFPDDPVINHTIVHNGNCSMYCYSNHGVCKNIPDSSIIDAQFYYSIEYTNLHCSPSHMLSIRNNESNPEDTIVFATIYLYTQDNEGNLPAMIEFKYCDGEYKYILNGSIPFVQWTPTEYHSVRMKLTLETNSSSNDGACNVWLDDEMIMNVSGLDTCGSIANQVAVGQLSTFSAYTFFDDVTILTITSNTLEVPEVLVIVLFGVVFAVIVLLIVVYKKLLKR
jgi:hypothetical protein